MMREERLDRLSHRPGPLDPREVPCAGDDDERCVSRSSAAVSTDERTGSTLRSPFTRRTHDLFAAEQFSSMKSTAVLVNASRGGVVDTAALADALRGGTIAHTVVDVLEEEPPRPDNPLFELENCTLTPHLGGCTDHGYDEIGELATELIERYLSGGELPAACVVVHPA